MLRTVATKGTACLKQRLSEEEMAGKDEGTNVWVKGLHNQERLPGGGECGVEPGKKQMPVGEEWLIIGKEAAGGVECLLPQSQS